MPNETKPAPFQIRLVPPVWHKMWQLWLKAQQFEFPDQPEIDNLEDKFYDLMRLLAKASKGIKRTK